MTPALIRIFDIIFSFLGLTFLSPLMLFVLLLCFFDTGRPIFWQERIGHNEIPFVIFKFRTMALNTTSVATHLASPYSTTPLGSFLRRTKLDELPQLWNVFKGEMSLVGPRPCLVNQFELIAARKKAGVFAARPGITGLAQVNGIDMSTPELLAQTDARMIAEMSVHNYLKYLFLTILGKGRGDRIK